VGRSAMLTQDVLHRKAPNYQDVGDHPPVATPPHRLRAHEADSLLAEQSYKTLEVRVELGRPHVVGVAAKGEVAPAGVRRIGMGAPAAPQARQVSVAYPALAGQPLRERLCVEVGVPRGVGEAAHVDQAASSVRQQEAEELLEGPRRMADGQDEARAGFVIRPSRGSPLCRRGRTGPRGPRAARPARG
jgi:hypothetical protein